MKKISILILIVLISLMIALIIRTRQSYNNISSFQKQLNKNQMNKNTEIENNTKFLADQYVNKNSYKAPSYIGSIMPGFQRAMIRLYELLNFY